MIPQDNIQQNHKLHILVLYPELFTSPIVNILTPLQYLVEQGLILLTHCREDSVTPQQVRAADVVVACRSVAPIVKPIYEYAKALGIPIIYDLDDNLFAVPKESNAYRYFGHPDKQKQLRWMIENVDLVRVHSQSLGEVIRSINEQVVVVWAAIDWSLAPEELPELRIPLEIVYAVSPDSGAMFYSIIREDVKRVLQDYSEAVRFYMLGYKDPELAKLANCIYVPFENDYKLFFKTFAQHGYAIGLAPMKEGLFYQCKTDIKFRDYAAAGAVGIFTDCPLYQQVEHGITGIKVQNDSGNWYTAIVNLLENSHKIETIRQTAQQFAFGRYHVDLTSQQWLKSFQSVKRKPIYSDIIHPEQWKFTEDERQKSTHDAAFLKLYHRFVPFRLHVLMSRLYHYIKKF